MDCSAAAGRAADAAAARVRARQEAKGLAARWEGRVAAGAARPAGMAAKPVAAPAEAAMALETGEGAEEGFAAAG